jgi:hypothetical protein
MPESILPSAGGATPPSPATRVPPPPVALLPRLAS